MVTKKIIFRSASWIKYGLIGYVIFLTSTVKMNNTDAIKVLNDSSVTSQKIIKQTMDQQERIQQRQKQILDKFNFCTSKHKSLDNITGECI